MLSNCQSLYIVKQSDLFCKKISLYINYSQSMILSWPNYFLCFIHHRKNLSFAFKAKINALVQVVKSFACLETI